MTFEPMRVLAMQLEFDPWNSHKVRRDDQLTKVVPVSCTPNLYTRTHTINIRNTLEMFPAVNR